jgi:endo-1,4-beta-xylanase
VIGSTVSFTASSTGCPSPQYQYWLQALDGSWSIQRAFSTDPTWAWNTTGLAGGVYNIHVWANQTGDATATWEAYGSSTVTLTGGSTCATASLSPASVTQVAGSTVNFTASSTGCPNPQYQYWVQALNGSWTIQRAFSADPTWAWSTVGVGPGVYSIHVWANQTGDSTATWEAYGSSTVTLTGVCTSASLSPSSGSAVAGTKVTFTASSSGCPSPVYEFWLQDTSGSWQMLQGFSAANTWVWDTTGRPKGTYNVHVWANQQGSDPSTWQAYGSSTYTLS